MAQLLKCSTVCHVGKKSWKKHHKFQRRILGKTISVNLGPMLCLSRVHPLSVQTVSSGQTMCAEEDHDMEVLLSRCMARTTCTPPVHSKPLMSCHLTSRDVKSMSRDAGPQQTPQVMPPDVTERLRSSRLSMHSRLFGYF